MEELTKRIAKLEAIIEEKIFNSGCVAHRDSHHFSYFKNSLGEDFTQPMQKVYWVYKKDLSVGHANICMLEGLSYRENEITSELMTKSLQKSILKNIS